MNLELTDEQAEALTRKNWPKMVSSVRDASSSVMADRAITEIYAEIQGSSDRATAIVSTAFIEDRLQRAICRRLVDDERTIKKITAPNGALSGFDNKLQLGYLLGVYIKDTRDNIMIVGQIRNKFAHRTTIKSFDDFALGRLFDRFTLHKRIVPPEDPLSIMVVDALSPTSTKRDIFLHIVHRLLGYFAYDDFGREQHTFKPLF
jgi:hypothetical protein